jgi:hypothetical protein
MLFSSWLRNWKASLERRGALRRTQRPKPAARRLTRRLCLEALEDRTLLSPVLTVNNLAVSGSSSASNTGTYSDSTPGATITAMAASTGTVNYSNGTWSWTPTGSSGTTAPVTIYATDSNGQTAATEFWLNVGQVFTVTNTGDNGGVNPAPGAGTGTLRQAIVDADNAPSTGEPSLIAFAIPTSDPGYNPTTGAFTITPLTPFPILSNPAVIDGYTEIGASPNTMVQGDNAVLNIQLNEQNWGPPNNPGFWVSANNSTIRGLVVNNLTTTYLISASFAEAA